MATSVINQIASRAGVDSSFTGNLTRVNGTHVSADLYNHAYYFTVGKLCIASIYMKYSKYNLYNSDTFEGLPKPVNDVNFYFPGTSLGPTYTFVGTIAANSNTVSFNSSSTGGEMSLYTHVNAANTNILYTHMVVIYPFA